MENILVAVIGGLCVAIPSVIATVVTSNKNQALTEYRLDKVEEKMDKHNKVIERTFVLEEKIEVANHRISDLENLKA